MDKTKEIVSNLLQNIVRVFKLSWEIDSRLVFLYFFTSALGAIFPIIAAYLFKIMLDNVVSNTSIANLQNSISSIIVLILAGYFFMKLLGAALYWGLNVNYLDKLLNNRLLLGLDRRYIKKMSSLDIGHLENSEIQNLITRVKFTYMEHVPQFLKKWNNIFRDLIGIISIFIALSAYNIWIPIAILLVSLPRFYFKFKLGKSVYSVYAASNPETRKMWYITDLLTEEKSIVETRIFQSQSALFGRLTKLQDSILNTTQKPLAQYSRTLVLSPIFENCLAFLLIYWMLPNALTGALTVGAITFIVSAMEQLRSNIISGTSNCGDLYGHNLFINPFFELMALPKLIKEVENPQFLQELKPPKIEFKNVHFSYPNSSKKVLNGVSFVIEPGQSLALVGVNGAGKTTIIKLLCRFYDADSGEIIINGINIKDLSLANWYSHLGTLFQDFVKYKFTFRDNIMLGAPQIQDENRMKEAALQSGAYEFINKYDRNFDQMLSKDFEEGEELSGGQWQKLAIARAFYQQAPVLILDEPTSAIDAESEYEIFQNLEKVYKNKTLIMVSHRFSTVRNASKIVVIEDGKIIESGTHRELLKDDGKYAQMFKIQAKGYT
ncbi:MAG: ABC transporter ATP-binding protein [Parcubacteria group bacterium]|nr:ABC transporter ATP-binding protein [Parcubacteria group bacterium]